MNVLGKELDAASVLTAKWDKEKAVDFPLLELLAAETGEHRSRAEQIKTNRVWNRQRMKAVQPGQPRACSLCKEAIRDGYLECPKAQKIVPRKGNTSKRLAGIHGRKGGHVTCLLCLKTRQGMGRLDVTRGVVKV